MGEFDAESEKELSTCWGRHKLVSWRRTRMVLEATAPSQDRSPPFCPRLSRLPSPSSQELRTSPPRWLLSGSPCTGPVTLASAPTPSTTQSPRGPSVCSLGHRGVIGLRRGSTALKKCGRKAALCSRLEFPQGAGRIDLCGQSGMPQGAAGQWTTWSRGQTKDFAGRCFGFFFFFFPSSSPTLLTLK